MKLVAMGFVLWIAFGLAVEEPNQGEAWKTETIAIKSPEIQAEPKIPAFDEIKPSGPKLIDDESQVWRPPGATVVEDAPLILDTEKLKADFGSDESLADIVGFWIFAAVIGLALLVSAGFVLLAIIRCIRLSIQWIKSTDNRLLTVWSWGAIFVLMGLFPPTRHGRYGAIAYQFLLSADTRSIHFSRLLIQWLILTVVAGVVVATVALRKRRRPPHSLSNASSSSI